LTEASNFNFGKPLGFAKSHHTIPPRRKSGRGVWLGELFKIWGFPFNIFAMAAASDFKFGT